MEKKSHLGIHAACWPCVQPNITTLVIKLELPPKISTVYDTSLLRTYSLVLAIPVTGVSNGYVEVQV